MTGTCWVLGGEINKTKYPPPWGSGFLKDMVTVTQTSVKLHLGMGPSMPMGEDNERTN